MASAAPAGSAGEHSVAMRGDRVGAADLASEAEARCIVAGDGAIERASSDPESPYYPAAITSRTEVHLSSG